MRERLIATLAGAGVPVDTVTGDGPGTVVTYQAWATPEQRGAGAAVLAAFDWTDSAQAEWEAERRRAEILTAVTSPDVVPSAARAGLLALMLSVQEARSKLNELITWANAQGAEIALLQTGDTFEEATEAVRQLVLAGVV